jgi:hypothetical protein
VINFVGLTVGAYFLSLKPKRSRHRTRATFCHTTLSCRINGFSDFAHRPDSKELEDKNTTLRKLDLFPSSGGGRHLLCWVP